MCWRARSEYDFHARTSARPERSLLGWLRDLWRPRRPQADEAEEVPFPAEAPVRADREAGGESSKAA